MDGAATMSDAEFLAAFEAAQIPRERWTHREHIRVAFVYLRLRPFGDALDCIRAGIRKLNRANGVADTDESGYHETITVAWARVVASALDVHGPTSDFFTFEKTHPHLGSKSLLRLYYTVDRVMSLQARASFVEPDVAPLPAEPAQAP